MCGTHAAGMQLPTSCSPVWKRVVCAARCPRSTARCGNRTCACGVMSADTCPPVQAPAAAKARGSTRVDSGGLEKKISKTDLNRLKRGGKGKSAFKSKSRFKRKKR
uniref:Uncharacterized protein n=1 Tax=Chlamydomonas euryale TaxID=1486919 RepID=A0A7R9VED5_9CHLO|mmetsp:Transcript_31667/g.94380  ORF Transcript_31667/g.94380 Transcript_31667/m.94380 type:complete len:106 (+) Transcript_31667:147-464(+)